MKQLIIGLVFGMVVSGTAAWAIHDIGHTTIFPEGSMLDRWQREDDAQKARESDRPRMTRPMQPC